MAEKFGLDWKEYDYERMAKFLEIILAEAERERRNAEKGSKKGTTKTHLR